MQIHYTSAARPETLRVYIYKCGSFYRTGVNILTPGAKTQAGCVAKHDTVDEARERFEELRAQVADAGWARVLPNAGRKGGFRNAFVEVPVAGPEVTVEAAPDAEPEAEVAEAVA